MVLDDSDARNYFLVAQRLKIEQLADMNLFYITDTYLVNVTQPRQGVTMVMKFRRKIMSEMMTTYFPSLLLMTITFATTFFKPFFFEAALSVNLTTMLVMTTIFISKMESLPPTSDIKMIDIWLILCQLVPFAQVVLLTAMEYLREEEKDVKEVEKQDKETQVEGGIANRQDEAGIVSEAEKESKPQEAWVTMITEPVAADTIKKLLIIGRFLRYR